MILRNLYLVVLLFCFYSNLKAECTTETLGLCTEGTTTEITNTEIIETIVLNTDSGDLLDGSNGFVTTTKEGDMDSDWGGQGSASMPTGSYCNELGTDKCAEITSSKLTTFYQQVDISSLNINYGGETNYTIEVDKQDNQDNIYMKIIGKNGNTEIFNGTDVLSATGVTSGYQSYSGGFDFGGSLTTLIIEIGGQDINLAVGVLFDDVSINVLYNVVTTIINQQIQDLEQFIYLNPDVSDETIDVAEAVYENNEATTETGEFKLEPIQTTTEEFTIETIEMEMNFEQTFDEAPEIQMANLEMEMEMELDLPNIESVEVEEVETETENIEEVKPEQATEETKQTNETEQEEVKEPEQNEIDETTEIETEEIKDTEDKEEPEKETTNEPKKIVNQKQKAANKIVKKMGDKGKYETNNQTKTLIVMQVLGNSKDFFSITSMLQDTQGFFNKSYLPDTTISDNSIASYLLFNNSDITMNEMVNSQYKR